MRGIDERVCPRRPELGSTLEFFCLRFLSSLLTFSSFLLASRAMRRANLKKASGRIGVCWAMMGAARWTRMARVMHKR
jgi:hypothetical protein